MPSVVSINSAGHENKKVRDRYGRIFNQKESTTSQGSGVIVSSEGHVITNYHVVTGMEQIDVYLADGRKFGASIVGMDSALDIAVLKIQSDIQFSAINFGDSDKVREGNIVLAFGNPFGIGKSITQGVISARERSISDLQGGLLQSSAAINPGYSGGPLVNIYGEIIGINSSIFTSDQKNRGFQGISFSIPSNIVQRTFIDIVERGRPVRGFLGVSFRPLSKSLRDLLAYSSEYGALLDDIGPHTPASKAGLEKNDIIIAYDGRAIRNHEQLIGLIQRTTVGKPVEIKVWRNRTELNLAVTLSEFNKNLATIPPIVSGNMENILSKVGVVADYISSYHRRSGISGVRVEKIREGSATHGFLRENDIIYQVNEYRISQPNEFYDIISLVSPQKNTEFFIIRDGVVRVKPITIPKL
jgi:serine protease Do